MSNKLSDILKGGHRPKAQFVEDKELQRLMEALNTHDAINALLQNLWEKDPYTYEHSHRVADFAQWIGKSLGLSSQDRVELYVCGLLHDIGKTVTPDSVLKKPGPLTPEEFSIMREHPVHSETLVKTVDDIAYLAPAIRAHHERIDGKGYPDALVGDAIPFLSRILLVADTFDAMTSTRVYRKEVDVSRTYDELIRCSGTQFDPEATRAFVASHQKLLDGLKPGKLAA